MHLNSELESRCQCRPTLLLMSWNKYQTTFDDSLSVYSLDLKRAVVISCSYSHILRCPLWTTLLLLLLLLYLTSQPAGRFKQLTKKTQYHYTIIGIPCWRYV